MALLIKYTQNGYIKSRAARVLHEYDDIVFIGTTSKLQKEITAMFVKGGISKVSLEEVKETTNKVIVYMPGLKYFYKIDVSSFIPEFPTEDINAIRWIQRKAARNPEKILMSREIYKRIVSTMFKKESSMWLPRFKLSGCFFDNVVEYARFELDESIPF